MSTFDCRVCGLNKPYSHIGEVHMGVSMPCAEPIANHFNYALGGGWLTWDSGKEKRRPLKTPIPTKLRCDVFKRDGYKCVDCGSEHDLAADHIHPECRGGEATFENLQTLCRPCNSRKGTR